MKLATKRPKRHEPFIKGLCAFLWLTSAAVAQTQDFETPDFKLKLSKTSQTVAALEPKSTPGFDFTPADRLSQRAANGYHHLGDLILRVRSGSSGAWQNYDTAESRAAVESLTASGPTLATADLSRTLPAGIALQITRSWVVDNGHLARRFAVVVCKRPTA